MHIKCTHFITQLDSKCIICVLIFTHQSMISEPCNITWFKIVAYSTVNVPYPPRPVAVKTRDLARWDRFSAFCQTLDFWTRATRTDCKLAWCVHQVGLKWQNQRRQTRTINFFEHVSSLKKDLIFFHMLNQFS